MSGPKTLLALLCLYFFTSISMHAQQVPHSKLTTDQWNADIDQFAQTLSAPGISFERHTGITSRGQVAFHKLYPTDSFTPAIASVRAHLNSRTDTETALELMRIVASAHVAHTTINGTTELGFDFCLPVRFTWLDKEVVVSASTTEFRNLVGQRLVSLAGFTPEQLEARLGPYLSSETPQWLHAKLANAIAMPAYLEALGVRTEQHSLTITVADESGQQQTVQLPISLDDMDLLSWYEIHNLNPPLRNQNPQRYYWYQDLPETHSAYIRYRVCMEDSKEHFSDFVHATMEKIDKSQPQRVIVDLRANRGGNSQIVQPLIKALQQRAFLRNRIFVLIDSGTFSSGLLAAVDFKKHLHATLVGSPSGENLESYGEVKQFKLRNSGLTVRYSTKHFKAPRGFAAGPLQPDLPAPLQMSTLFSEQDPALFLAQHAAIPH